MIMKSNIPNQPRAESITPIVYVKDKTIWQYKLLTRNLAKEDAPSEEELNKVGKRRLGPCRDRYWPSLCLFLFQEAERLKWFHHSTSRNCGGYL